MSKTLKIHRQQNTVPTFWYLSSFAQQQSNSNGARRMSVVRTPKRFASRDASDGQHADRLDCDGTRPKRSTSQLLPDRMHDKTPDETHLSHRPIGETRDSRAVNGGENVWRCAVRKRIALEWRFDCGAGWRKACNGTEVTRVTSSPLQSESLQSESLQSKSLRSKSLN